MDVTWCKMAMAWAIISYTTRLYASVASVIQISRVVGEHHPWMSWMLNRVSGAPKVNLSIGIIQINTWATSIAMPKRRYFTPGQLGRLRAWSLVGSVPGLEDTDEYLGPIHFMKLPWFIWNISEKNSGVSIDIVVFQYFPSVNHGSW